jgi:arsenate reductase
MSDAKTPELAPHRVTIYHNPNCSNSRTALGILQERSVDLEVVEYLVSPPSRETLEKIISKLRDPVADLVRSTDKRFLELGLDPGAYVNADDVIELLLVHPELMQRPIVIRGDRAVIARPGDRVAEVLA